MRHTVCANLNDSDPEQAEILKRLGAASSVSAEIVAALKAYYGGSKLAGITEFELGELHARLAWLEQNQGAAPAVNAEQPTGDPPDETPQAQSGPALTEVFLSGVRKMAKPGIRLGD